MKHRYGFLLLLLLLPVVAGCWSRREVNELAIISGTGLDWDRQSEMVELTVQMLKPQQVGGGQMGAGGAGGQGKPVVVRSTKGRTIAEAIRRLEMETPRKLFWSHNRIIVLGEDFARRGVEALDFFSRERETRLISWVLVARGRAREILGLGPDLEKIPALSVSSLTKQRTGMIVNLKDFLIMLSSWGDNPVTGTVAPVENKQENGQGQSTVSLVGAAAFRDGKLVGWLDDREMRGLMWLRGKIKRGVITVPCPRYPDEPLSFTIRSASTRIIPQVRDGFISFLVEIREEGELIEQWCQEDFTKPDKIKELEKLKEKEIKMRAGEVLQKAQEEWQTDIFGFGEALRRRYPRVWKQVRENWNEEFAYAEINLVVEAKIRRTGMTSKPTQIK
ncbi:Ger(x)C family spore germination protein [Calderihabitans maritimus]|uniref:Ger(X)C family germination protein n=1 Tax=Calderihabitans maritimus TaxID=1246530 RepID=A0A1Z5HT25_9FIRM|nr:Ger(x)C family spore germination protein [Calderihabitans maritimus]GAW92420.1 Ger(x)C family germination protein [Calderihabitans maritimus]